MHAVAKRCDRRLSDRPADGEHRRQLSLEIGGMLHGEWGLHQAIADSSSAVSVLSRGA